RKAKARMRSLRSRSAAEAVAVASLLHLLQRRIARQHLVWVALVPSAAMAAKSPSTTLRSLLQPLKTTRQVWWPRVWAAAAATAASRLPAACREVSDSTLVLVVTAAPAGRAARSTQPMKA